MKMKKMMFLMLTLLVWGVASMNAQVRIGGTAEPATGVVLDLNATDATNNGHGSLVIPRVQLTGNDDVTTVDHPQNGMLVYNVGGASSGATQVWNGLYIYSNGQWWKLVGVGNTTYLKSTITVTNLPANDNRMFDLPGVTHAYKCHAYSMGVLVTPGDGKISFKNINTSSVINGTYTVECMRYF